MSITVTKPFLPPAAEYQAYVDGIWRRGWLTNNGPLVNELELQLKRYLGLDYLLFASNGTIALQLAIKALDLTGEVITTPFSYVATTSSLVWQGCEPVMVDISPASWNINPTMIEASITPRTTAILATHVYGNPCDVDAIESVARKHGLKVIYDAAHAFGSRYKGKSLFAYGDISIASFHATKLFHTVEGGAVISREPETLRRLALLRNFGHITPTEFECVGINGKNSEMHAAMGLSVLPYIDEILAVRRRIAERYNENLRTLSLGQPEIANGCVYNNAYYPVMFESESTLHRVLETLAPNNIFPRRYFYPPLSALPYLKNRQSTPICNDISPRVLCLPMYHSLSMEEVDMVSRLIYRTVKYG